MAVANSADRKSLRWDSDGKGVVDLGRPAARLSAPLWFFGLSGFSTAVSGTGTSILVSSKTEVERAVMAEVSGTSCVRCANLTDRPFSRADANSFK